LTPAGSGGNSLTLMALAALMLGFSSATQDIVIDAYRIESAKTELQAIMSSTYIAGYRIGMLTSGAGALFLASAFGTEMGDYNYSAWRWAYLIMAGVMLVGVITTLLVPEPEQNKTATETQHSTRDYLGFLLLFLIAIIAFIATFFFSAGIATDFKKALAELFGNKALAGFLIETIRLATAVVVAGLVAQMTIRTGIVNREMVQETYIDPVQEFFQRYGIKLAVLLLALISLYRISDIVLGVISNLFYQDLGFTKVEIASVVKTFGLFMTIAGGFLGGVLSLRYGVMRILFLGALLSAVTNLLFMALAQMGNDIGMLYLVISADNLSAGLASAAFIAFLSSLTNISFTAMQYAIFSSLMTLLPKLLGGYSGVIVEAVDYPSFFLITALLGLPVLLLIWWAGKRFEIGRSDS